LLIVRFGIMPILFIGGVASAGTNILFLMLADMGPNLEMLVVTISLDNFSSGMATSAFVAYLSSLVEHPDAWIAGRASAELGLAWMQGRGTRKQSRFAAIEWANRAAALQPGDSAIEDIQAEILNSHNRVKTLFTQCG
ncbi:hypothetical protein SB912_23810, partial [Pantoea sp. SIMBA_072]